MDLSFAKQADALDPLKKFRSRFIMPGKEGDEKIYFLGNSLGLQPVGTAAAIQQVLDQWSELGVEGFFHGPRPWLRFHEKLAGPLADIVGCLPDEIVVMNQLTVNLHLLLASFYRPSGKKNRIICEAKAFPSDQYMLETHVLQRGLDPGEVLITVHPREGEHHVRQEDIIDAISIHSGEVCMVFIGGVNYYTGQVFDIAAITVAAHEAGAVAGFDLAHAAGNIPLQLHQWNVDFAAWCCYKYLNAGPGAVAAAYIHERYHNDPLLPRLAGWWGYRKAERFHMEPSFRPDASAEGWQVSTPPVILFAALQASLEIFSEATMDSLVSKGGQLSDFLLALLRQTISANGGSTMEVITPAEKGCQVSLLFRSDGRRVFEGLQENGIFADWREPGVIRVAPVPLYNTFEEVFRFSEIIKNLMA